MSNGDDEPQKECEEKGETDGATNKSLDARFECPICLSCMRDPVLTTCGHKFCSQCLHQWLEKKGGCCPVDSTPLKPENGDLFLDRFTSREISQYKTKCPYQQFGCTVELSPIDMDRHINSCEYTKSGSTSQTFDCDFKHVGCDEVFPDEESLKRHLEENLKVHLTIMAKALSKMIINQSEVNQRVRDSELWDPPLKNKDVQSDQASGSTDVDKLLKDLSERIVVLEQQNREQAITITNQKIVITQMRNNLTTQQEKYWSNCNGIYVWRIDEFSIKITEMMTEGKMLYSDEFYTHKNGYKVCGRMNISKKNLEFLSIVLHLVPSENDDSLDWPFIGVISFVLVHPDDSDKSIRERTYSVPGLEAFKKPGTERNRRSFGYTEFISVHELPNFIRDDRLIFRLEVKATDRFDIMHFSEHEKD